MSFLRLFKRFGNYVDGWYKEQVCTTGAHEPVELSVSDRGWIIARCEYCGEVGYLHPDYKKMRAYSLNDEIRTKGDLRRGSPPQFKPEFWGALW